MSSEKRSSSSTQVQRRKKPRGNWKNDGMTRESPNPNLLDLPLQLITSFLQPDERLAVATTCKLALTEVEAYCERVYRTIASCHIDKDFQERVASHIIAPWFTSRSSPSYRVLIAAAAKMIPMRSTRLKSSSTMIAFSPWKAQYATFNQKTRALTAFDFNTKRRLSTVVSPSMLDAWRGDKIQWLSETKLLVQENNTVFVWDISVPYQHNEWFRQINFDRGSRILDTIRKSNHEFLYFKEGATLKKTECCLFDTTTMREKSLFVVCGLSKPKFLGFVHNKKFLALKSRCSFSIFDTKTWERRDCLSCGKFERRIVSRTLDSPNVFFWYGPKGLCVLKIHTASGKIIKKGPVQCSFPSHHDMSPVNAATSENVMFQLARGVDTETLAKLSLDKSQTSIGRFHLFEEYAHPGIFQSEATIHGGQNVWYFASPVNRVIKSYLLKEPIVYV
jgi:hypothetical protein